jgi:hypothetical protein
VKLLIATTCVVSSVVAMLPADISHGSPPGQEQKNFIRLSRTGFETYSSYPDDPIAQANISCNADGWSVTADWGDGTAPEILSHSVPSEPHAPTPSGTYPLYSTHKYVHSGAYDASFKLLVNCSGNESNTTGQESYRTEVFDHVPIRKFVAESAEVRRGTPVILILELVTIAPKSGTRVVFQTNNAAGVFQPAALPKIVTIPPNSDHVTLRIPTLKTAPVGTVTLTVLAVNGPHSLQIKIE